MTKVTMRRCDMCEVFAESMNEGVVRLDDRPVEVRFDICDDCVEQNYGNLPESPRRGRRAEMLEEAGA